jgi:FAD/FMN-containing dehydrogenase
MVVAEGFDGSVKAAVQAAKDAAAHEDGESTVEADSGAVEAALRDLAQRCGGGNERAGALIRASVAPGRLIPAIGALLAGLASSELSVEWQADVGVGSLFARLNGPDAGMAAAIGRARAGLAALGGNLVVSDGSAALRRTLDPWDAPTGAAPLAKAIKARMDPSGTLNPGRYCYGL